MIFNSGLKKATYFHGRFRAVSIPRDGSQIAILLSKSLKSFILINVMIRAIKKLLENLVPHLGFNSPPNLEKAWNVYFASPRISDSYKHTVVLVS